MKNIYFYIIVILISIYSVNSFSCEYDQTVPEDWQFNPNYTWTHVHTIDGTSTDASIWLASEGYYYISSGFSVYSNDSIGRISVRYGKKDSDNDGQITGDENYDLYYVVYSILGDVCESVPDADGDGIPDETDLTPNDPTPYSGELTKTVTNNSTGQVVAGEVTLTNGDVYTFGEEPADLDGHTVTEIEPGYSTQSAESLSNMLESFNGDLNIQQVGSGGNLEIDDDGTIDYDTYSPSNTSLPSEIDTQTADAPDPGTGTGTEQGEDSTGNETDSEAFGKIIDNTGKTADNVSRAVDYLAEGNNYLSKIYSKLSEGISTTSDTQTGYEGPSAEEIGSAVNDSLTGDETHDGSSTTSIESVDNTQFFTDQKTQIHNRLVEFNDELKATDFWDLPNNLLPDLPTGGTSQISVNIGQWGYSTDQYLEFDMADYNIAWDTLKYILPILTLLTCLRILILKQA